MKIPLTITLTPGISTPVGSTSTEVQNLPSVFPFSFNGITNTSTSPSGFPNICDPLVESTPILTSEIEDIPDFSVIMTVAKRNCYFLRQALESIRYQFWKNIELVACVDDLELKGELLQWSEYTGIPVNVEVCPTVYSRTQKFMSCAKRCKGVWTINVDCDDILPTDALTTLDLCLKRYPEFGVFCTGHNQIDTRGNFLHLLQPIPQQNTIGFLQDSFFQRHLWGWHKDWIGRLRSSFICGYVCEDYNFFVECAKKEIAVMCIPYPLYCYRRHSVQLTVMQKDSVAAMVDGVQSRTRLFIKKAPADFFMREWQRVELLNTVFEQLRDTNLDQIPY